MIFRETLCETLRVFSLLKNSLKNLWELCHYHRLGFYKPITSKVLLIFCSPPILPNFSFFTSSATWTEARNDRHGCLDETSRNSCLFSSRGRQILCVVVHFWAKVGVKLARPNHPMKMETDTVRVKATEDSSTLINVSNDIAMRDHIAAWMWDECLKSLTWVLPTFRRVQLSHSRTC